MRCDSALAVASPGKPAWNVAASQLQTVHLQSDYIFSKGLAEPGNVRTGILCHAIDIQTLFNPFSFVGCQG